MLSTATKKIFDEVLELSEKNLTNNRVPIAAIIYDYKKQQIIARATNTNSPIGHAELEAIREALEIKKTNRLDDCDIYVTIEPCLMCATAISKCHMRRIYFGAEDKKGGAIDNGVRIFSNCRSKAKLEVYAGFSAEKSEKLLKEFFKEIR